MMKENKETQKDIEIHGEMLRIDVSHQEFLEEMFKWLSSKGWSFRGTTKPIEKEVQQPSNTF